jgi:hypothetical protein
MTPEECEKFKEDYYEHYCRKEPDIEPDIKKEVYRVKTLGRTPKNNGARVFY